MGHIGSKVKELTNGEGVDFALELVWTDIEKTISSMKVCGKIVIAGLLGGLTTNVSVVGLISKHLQLEGIQTGSKESFMEMNKAIDVNKIKPVIDKTFPMSEFKESLEYFDQGRHFGKVVLRMK